MPRYFVNTKARVQDGDGYALSPGSPYGTIEPMTDERPVWVDAAEHVAHETGILDANGDMIMRAPRPIGFGRDEDW